MGKGHDAGRDQRAIFAQRVAHHHVRPDAVLAQQLVEGRVHGQHGRLGDGRLHQVALGLLHSRRIGVVHKDVAGQRAAQDRRHHRVSLAEGLGHHRLKLGQLATHVAVLAALAWEKEGDLARGCTAPAKDALRAQRLPGLGIVEASRLAGLGKLVQQLVVVAEVDHQALRLAQLSRAWRGNGRSPAALDLLPGGVQPILQRDGIAGADGQNAAHRLFGSRQGRSRQGRSRQVDKARVVALNTLSTCVLVYLSTCFLLHLHPRVQRPLAAQHARHVLLQHHVEVGAAEAVGADAGAAGEPVGLGPLTQVMVEDEGRVAEIGVGVGSFGVEGRRQDFFMHRHHGLEQTSRARAGLEVADIAFGRAQCDAAARRAGEDLAQALQLDNVADLGAGAVRLQQGGAGRIEAGVGPSALGRQNLADGVGGGDALAFAVAGTAHAADHGVDLIAVALSVGQTLEQEGRAALAHDEAVRAVAEGPAAGCAQRADLAELDEDAGAHVAVDAAGHHGVHLAGCQQLHRRVDGSEAGGAGRVGDEAGAAQVEHVGHPAGDDVGQFARHGVLGDGRQGRVHALVPLG